MSGDGFHDFGEPNANLSDLVWTISARAAHGLNVDTNTPGKVTRVGYVAYGTSNDGTTDQTQWRIADFKYVEFEGEDWIFLNDVHGLMRFVQWHLLQGWELTTDVYVY